MLDYKLSVNVQNIWLNNKRYQENHENLESRIDRRKEKLCWNKDTKYYIRSKCTKITIIYNWEDANEMLTQKIHCRKQTYKIA